MADGAALDVNAQQLGFENIIVSGAGPNGLGAIINSSGTEQQNAVRKITLAGNTTLGATEIAGISEPTLRPPRMRS